MTAQLDWGMPCAAPAKINLFLHITGRRPDGYHLLQTAFRLLDHGDTLQFFPAPDGQVSLRKPLPGVPVESDLCVRAARLLQTHTGSTQGVDIDVTKRLPMGGGLGGGSSDAATVLLALNQLWSCQLSMAELQTLGLQLGADVPVFIGGQNAFAEGVGEVLHPLTLPERWYVVLEPPAAVPTARIFSAPDLCRSTPIMAQAEWQPGQGHNDLEPIACQLFPVIREYLDWLNQFAPARMSGSGACVFAEFTSPDEAAEVLRQCLPTQRAWLAKGLAEHPLRPACIR